MKSYNKYLEANKLRSLGYYYKALKIYMDLYRDEPDNDLINYSIGKTLLEIHNDIYNHTEIEIQIRNHLKKSGLRGIAQLGLLEEKLGNVEAAIKQYKKAIKFENDDDAFYNLICLYIKLGNIDEAQNYYNLFLDSVKSSFSQKEINETILYLLGKSAMYLNDSVVANKVFNYLKDSPHYRESVLEGLMKLEVKNENYEQAYQIYLELKKIDEAYDNNLLLFILYKLNRLNKDYETRHDYYKNQLLEYSIDYAIEHIEKHKDMFMEKIDIVSLFDICRRSINDLDPINKKYNAVDQYLLEFESNIGTINGKPTNRVEIRTIQDTKNILTLYPTITEKRKYTTNPISILNKNSSQKVKRKSQIEKFNSKYNLQ